MPRAGRLKSGGRERAGEIPEAELKGHALGQLYAKVQRSASSLQMLKGLETAHGIPNNVSIVSIEGKLDIGESPHTHEPGIKGVGKANSPRT